MGKFSAITGLLSVFLFLGGCFKKFDTIGKDSTNKFVDDIESSSKNPSCRITSSTAGWWTSRSFTLNYSCVEGVSSPDDLIETVECRSSQSLAWAECSTHSAHTYSGLPDGAMLFNVRARSESGRYSKVASFKIKIDATVPEIQTLRLEGLIANVPTFSVVATDAESGVHRLLCRVLQGTTLGAWYECGSAMTTTLTLANLIANKDHTLQVKVVDKATNESSVASVDFRTDYVAPLEICQIAPLASPTRLRNATLNFVCASAHMIQRRECRLDVGPWVTCASDTSHAVSGLSDGPHTFDLRFVNKQGLASPVAQRTWIVDTTPPRVEIVSSASQGLSAQFDFTATDANGITKLECSVHRSTGVPVFSACSGTYLVDSLNPGLNYTFVVKATDAAGNVGQASYQWDTTPPTGLPTCTILTSFPNSYSTSADSTVAFSCSSSHGSVSFPQCRIGTGSWGSCSSVSSHLVQGLTDGSDAEVCVRTSDQWNRSSGDNSCLRWKVSLVAPQILPIAVDVAHPYAKLFFEASPSSCPIVGYDCALAGPSEAHAYKSCQSPQLYSGLVLNADYTFSVKAMTLCGQVSPTRTITWKARATYRGPICRLVPADEASGLPWIKNSPALANIECEDDGPAHSYECSGDGQSWSACSTPVSIEAQQTGAVTRYVRGVDIDGVRGAVSQSHWNFDLNNPLVQVTQLSWTPGGHAQLFFSASDVGSGVKETQCSIDGLSAWTPCSSPATFTDAVLSGEGASFSFRVRAVDHAGRISPDATRVWANGGWSDWGTCAAVAGGGGTQSRTCSQPNPVNGGLACAGASERSCTPPPPPTCSNGASNHPACSTCPAGQAFAADQVCRPVATNGGWTQWGACTVSCGGGYQLRSCAQPISEYASSTCHSGQVQGRACNTQACCLGSGTYLGRGDVPGYSREEVTCQSSVMPGPVDVADTSLGCCSGVTVYSNPRVKHLITCGPGTNCSFCPKYVPGHNQPNYNWDDWEVRCK
jgi:hypothetical protein